MNISKEQFNIIIEEIKKDSGINSEFEKGEVCESHSIDIKGGFTFTFDYNIWVNVNEYLYSIDDISLYSIDLGEITLTAKDINKLQQLALELIWMDFEDYESEDPREHAFNIGD